MSLNVTIEDTSSQNGVVGERYRNCPLLLLLCLLMPNWEEELAIGCYPLFSNSEAYRFSKCPFPFPGLLFGWTVSEAFSSFFGNRVIDLL